jgi:four helix bundle protein
MQGQREAAKRRNPSITGCRILEVTRASGYQAAIEAAMRIFEITKRFPSEERFSMVDQMRRSSRSVCSNIGEAWRKRRYPAHFVSKLSDSEGEAEETRVWLELAFRCGYVSKIEADELDREYDGILGRLVRMIEHPEQWTIRARGIQVKNAGI